MTNGYSHSPEGYSLDSGSPFRSSITEGVIPPHIPGGVSCDGDDDVARIARAIYTDELADLIMVLRNCGALRTKVEYFWCVKELWRLLRAGN